MDYRRAVTIHGDDVLCHTNWEIGEEFLRRYGYAHGCHDFTLDTNQQFAQVLNWGEHAQYSKSLAKGKRRTRAPFE